MVVLLYYIRGCILGDIVRVPADATLEEFGRAIAAMREELDRVDPQQPRLEILPPSRKRRARSTTPTAQAALQPYFVSCGFASSSFPSIVDPLTRCADMPTEVSRFVGSSTIVMLAGVSSAPSMRLLSAELAGDIAARAAGLAI
jgi:hypothetical protein